MEDQTVIAICQMGGEFEKKEDGSLSYKGGEAHAYELSRETKFDQFQREIFEMFNCKSYSISVKYFLPGNRKTLITVSSDKDLQRMIKFHGNSFDVDVFIKMEDVVPINGSNMPTSRSSRTTVSRVLTSVDPVADIVDMDSNINNQISNPIHTEFSVIDPLDQVDNNEDDYDLADHTFSLPFSDSNNIPAAESRSQIVLQWQSTITGVGQRFKGVHEFRETIRRYAIAHQFAFRYIKNDSSRVTVGCKAEGCGWRIHASKLSTTQLICIKKMNPTHTCDGAASTTGYQATRNWVASVIKEKLKVAPNYKPKDIINDIKKEFGVQLNYFQAWRGKGIAKEELLGSFTEAYSQLPIFCEKIMETNPGSCAHVTIREDSTFHGLFVSFRASLVGFRKGCRPLLFLDSMILNSKYQGSMFTATAADGDDKAFPVAFGVVDVETDDNWHWFLTELKTALGGDGHITFVADREKGLEASIPAVFPSSFHGYCLQYLSQQLIKEMKVPLSNEVKRLLICELYAAALAPKAEEFHGYLERIKSMSLEAYLWVKQTKIENWANFSFLGARYDHMDSNFGEVLYSWASEPHELPITQVVELIRGKIMDVINTRRLDSNQWLTELTPSMEEKLHRGSMECSGVVSVITDHRYLVSVDTKEIEQVDLRHRTCSCNRWQLTGMPCRHTLILIGFLKANHYEYCSRYFTTEYYKQTYADSILPIPHIPSPLPNDSLQTAVIVSPPFTRRSPGRPSSRKYGKPDHMKRELRCSMCKGAGHNKLTCTNKSR